VNYPRPEACPSAATRPSADCAAASTWHKADTPGAVKARRLAPRRPTSWLASPTSRIGKPYSSSSEQFVLASRKRRMASVASGTSCVGHRNRMRVACQSIGSAPKVARAQIAIGDRPDRPIWPFNHGGTGKRPFRVAQSASSKLRRQRPRQCVTDRHALGNQVCRPPSASNRSSRCRANRSGSRTPWAFAAAATWGRQIVRKKRRAGNLIDR